MAGGRRPSGSRPRSGDRRIPWARSAGAADTGLRRPVIATCFTLFLARAWMSGGRLGSMVLDVDDAVLDHWPASLAGAHPRRPCAG